MKPNTENYPRLNINTGKLVRRFVICGLILYFFSSFIHGRRERWNEQENEARRDSYITRYVHPNKFGY